MSFKEMDVLGEISVFISNQFSLKNVTRERKQIVRTSEFCLKKIVCPQGTSILILMPNLAKTLTVSKI